MTTQKEGPRAFSTEPRVTASGNQVQYTPAPAPMQARFNLDSLDPLTVAVLGGVLLADRHRAATALSVLQRGDVPSPVAEAFNAAHAAMRDGHNPDPLTVADYAVKGGFISPGRQAMFGLFLIGATDPVRCHRGEAETFRAHQIALGAARAHVTATSTRLAQAADDVADDDMPGTLAALAEDMHRTADRFADLTGGELS